MTVDYANPVIKDTTWSADAADVLVLQIDRVTVLNELTLVVIKVD